MTGGDSATRWARAGTDRGADALRDGGVGVAEPLEVRIACAPGACTPERALRVQQAVIDLLDELSRAMGVGVAWRAAHMEWRDDGTDEIVVRVTA